jgi:hypothetical protein
MPKTLTVVFRRDTSRDRQNGKIQFQGYQLRWPDGRPVAVGLNAFCRQGQRLLGLSKRLADEGEHLLELLCFPLDNREDDLTRMPGHRVRRFVMKRHNGQGRIHFLDGTPTETVFDVQRDEARVLEWIGLTALGEGDEQWFDIAARVVQPAY